MIRDIVDKIIKKLENRGIEEWQIHNIGFNYYRMGVNITVRYFNGDIISNIDFKLVKI